MSSNHLTLCHPLLLLPSVFPSIRVFSNELALCIVWPKYWSFNFSISPSNDYSGWFPLGWTGWISCSPRDFSRVFSNTTVRKHQFSGTQPSLWFSSHIHTWLLEKTIALTIWTFVGKVMSLLFNVMSMFVIAFLPRTKCLLISWLQSQYTVILEPQNRLCHCFHFFPIYLPWSDGAGCHDLCFWMLSFKPTFSLSSFTFIKRLFSSPSLSTIQVVPSAYLRLLIFLPAILIPTWAY